MSPTLAAGFFTTDSSEKSISRFSRWTELETNVHKYVHTDFFWLNVRSIETHIELNFLNVFQSLKQLKSIIFSISNNILGE